MSVTRRGLLGMFAAGAAAAVLPSGIIMPVRKIVTPLPGIIGMDLGACDDAMVYGIGFEVWSWDGCAVRHVVLPCDAVLRSELKSYRFSARPVGEIPHQSGTGLARSL